MLRRRATQALSGIWRDQFPTSFTATLTAQAYRQIRRQSTRAGEYQHFNTRSSFGGYEGLASRRTLSWASLAAGGSFVVWVSNREEVPYTGRMHCILVPTSIEQSIGETTFQQIRSEAKSQGSLLPEHHPYVKLIKRIGTRIAQKASDDTGVSGHMNHMKGLKWEFAVIDSDQVNAFVVPGGKVVVYTGLLKLLQGPAMETQVAAVLGHEIAHVVARHAAERMTQSEVADLVRTAVYIVVGIPIPAGAAAAVFFLPHSRRSETEADSIGMRLAAKACYDPSAAAAVFQKLGAEEAKARGAQIPRFLRTHPLTEERIRNVREQLPAASIIFDAADCQSSRRYMLDSMFGPQVAVQL
ncbi:hypothetical protein ABBQ32_006432 [Trebouxia sp. C0010 RCD-2024]